MNKNLENITTDGLKALRDAVVIGGITFLICEAGDNTLNETVLTAKAVGVFGGLVDYGTRLLQRYAPEQVFGYTPRP